MTPIIDPRDQRPAPRPNFFIIGAMKAGTTSLHQYLARHPQVFMCEPKEPGYFSEPDAWARGVDWYLSLFAKAGDAKVIGESSTHYTKLPTKPGVPERIRDFNPEARFVYLMRDPLERMLSHYLHMVRDLGPYAERRRLDRAVLGDPELLGISDYAMQLRPYFNVFGRDRVRCLTFEEMIADPAGVTEGILGWLGVTTPVPRDIFERRFNARPAEVRRATGRGLPNGRSYSRPGAAIAALLPRALRRFAKGLGSEAVETTPDVTAPVLDELRPLVRERVADLSALLGRTFPEWKTVGPVAAERAPGETSSPR